MPEIAPKIDKDKVLGLAPARGGSKSMPLKNLALLGGRPLLEYGLHHAAAAMPHIIQTLVCSTDHDGIANAARACGAEVIMRPPELATDLAPVEDGVRHVLGVLEQRDGAMPDIVVLFQPTSPFLHQDHIEGLVNILRNDSSLDAAQTIAEIPHNMHALNQRVVDDDGVVAFRFLEERKIAYNKKLKPKHYRFGNLVAFRSAPLMAGGTCFGTRSGSLLIDDNYAHDVDGPDDFEFANFLIENGRIKLPF
jgi:CMP-N,N'-diacetyllegionaminic acid synthase